jgi:hypothetical protein
MEEFAKVGVIKKKLGHRTKKDWTVHIYFDFLKILISCY